jgi:hypothetical protein
MISFYEQNGAGGSMEAYAIFTKFTTLHNNTPFPCCEMSKAIGYKKVWEFPEGGCFLQPTLWRPPG